MKAHITHARASWRLLLAVLALSLFGTGSLTAQLTPFSWERTYDASQCWHRGVKTIPVKICGGGGGYITIGVTGPVDCAGISSDIFVVRTSPLGAVIWANTYHLGLPTGANNVGGIVECADGTGFAIAGAGAGLGGFDQAFIMKLGCDGGILWTRGYGFAGVLSRGNDIIETPALSGAAAGDLVICGDLYNTTEGLLDAILVRVDNLGNPIWANAYTTVTRHEILYSLTAAAPVPPARFGDIISVGTVINPAVVGPAADAMILRVDPTLGTFPGAQNRMAIYTDPIYPGTNQLLLSVVELKNGGVGNIVAAGHHGPSNQTPNGEIFMLETAPNPCTRLTDQLIGMPNIRESAVSVLELTAAYPAYGAAIGDLVIGGINEQPPFITDYDLAMIGVNPVTLAPLPATGRLFGRPSNETGGFVAEVPAAGGNAQGFIVTGTTNGNLNGYGAPSDVFLAKTNAAGATGCHAPWAPNNETPGMVLQECTVPVVRSMVIMPMPTLITGQGFGHPPVCPSLLSKPGEDRGSVNDGAPGLEESAGGSLLAYPNPVNAGETVGIRFSSAAKVDLQVTIADALGRTVSTTTVPSVLSGTTFPVGTEGLTAGVYTIVVTDGTRTETSRIVVR